MIFRTYNRLHVPLKALALVSVFAALVCIAAITDASIVSAQENGVATATRFRLGEKLAYNITFGKFNNAGYAETHVVSRGKLGGKDAIEIRSKIKTFELVSAAFFRLDESRTVFAAPDTGLPLYVSTVSHDSVIPKETISNYLTQPTQSFDLLTLIFRAREVGGVGTFPLYENGTQYSATLTPGGVVTAQTPAGNFETVVTRFQSDFLAANGIIDLHIHFTTDETRVPAVIRFSTVKGEFKAILSAIVLPEPEPSPTPTPVPVPTITPPIAIPTPTPQTDNKPLARELGFELGEVLDYRITTAGKMLGTITLNARERKMVETEDTLFLTATITGVEPGNNLFRLGDKATAQVNAETLAPKRSEARFASVFPGLNHTAVFDRITGIITFGPSNRVDAPIGTHSMLSLVYAMRSFNLKRSKNATNPVNDTRVAVFWENKAYVFTLRPSDAAELVMNDEKISAQLITINTGNKNLDALLPKVWLESETRVPVRFTFGVYQADLIARSSNLSR